MRKSSTSSHKQAHRSILVLCLVCLFVTTVRSQTVDVVQVFEEIATLIQNNRLPEAEKELNAILRVSPDNPTAVNLLGTIRSRRIVGTHAQDRVEFFLGFR